MPKDSAKCCPQTQRISEFKKKEFLGLGEKILHGMFCWCSKEHTKKHKLNERRNPDFCKGYLLICFGVLVQLKKNTIR